MHYFNIAAPEDKKMVKRKMRKLKSIRSSKEKLQIVGKCKKKLGQMAGKVGC